MIPVSASVRLRDLLAGLPDGPVPVVHHGRLAVYVEVTGRCVGVLSRHATAVPCGLRSSRDHLDGRSAHVTGGVLHLDGEPCVVRRLVDVSVPRLTLPPSARADVPAPAPGDVAGMVGRGDGLTPYQDDVLCGWLAVHRAAGVATPEVDAAVAAARHRTTLLSATLLECAHHGEALPELAAYLRAVGSPQESERAVALAAVGHSSGRGLLQGAGLALAGLRIDTVPTVVHPSTHRGAAA